MKDELKTRVFPNEGHKMTLKGYYQNLPESTHPKHANKSFKHINIAYE